MRHNTALCVGGGSPMRDTLSQVALEMSVNRVWMLPPVDWGQWEWGNYTKYSLGVVGGRG